MSADDCKAQGNACFKAGDYITAIKNYSRAIEFDPSNFIHYSNRSAAFSKIKEWKNSKDDALKCTELNPGFFKGWSRLAAAESALGNFEQAAAFYRRALEIEPNDGPASNDLQEVLAALEMRKNLPHYAKLLLDQKNFSEVLGVFSKISTPELVVEWRRAMEEHLKSCDFEAARLLWTEVVPLLLERCGESPELSESSRLVAVQMSIVACDALLQSHFPEKERALHFQCQQVKAHSLSLSGRSMEAVDLAQSLLQRLDRQTDSSIWFALTGISVKSRAEYAAAKISMATIPPAEMIELKQILGEVVREVEEASDGDIQKIRSIVIESFTIDNIVSAYQLACEISVILHLGNIKTGMKKFLDALRILIDIHPISQNWSQLCMRFVVGSFDFVRRAESDDEKRLYADEALKIIDNLISAGIKSANVQAWRATALLLHPGGGKQDTITESGNRGKKLRAREAIKIAGELESSTEIYMMKEIDIEITRANACLLLGTAISDQEGRDQSIDRAVAHLRTALDHTTPAAAVANEDVTLKFYVLKNYMNVNVLLGETLMKSTPTVETADQAIKSFEDALTYSDSSSPLADLAAHAETLFKLAGCYLWRGYNGQMPFNVVMDELQTCALNQTLSTLKSKDKKDIIRSYELASKALSFMKGDNWGLSDLSIDLTWLAALSYSLTLPSPPSASSEIDSYWKHFAAVVDAGPAESDRAAAVQYCSKIVVANVICDAACNTTLPVHFRIKMIDFSSSFSTGLTIVASEKKSLEVAIAARYSVNRRLESVWALRRTLQLIEKDQKKTQALFLTFGVAGFVALAGIWFLKNRAKN